MVHWNVVIVGAGISGIGSAYYLSKRCPDVSFVVFEKFSDFGGTWRTFHYPGARSDSDMYTYGYTFKPWSGLPIASGSDILSYLGDTIDETNLRSHFRFHHRINEAKYSKGENTWTLNVSNTKESSRFEVTCNFLWMCSGYFRHDRGYAPTWEGVESFRGQIVHPQSWPEKLDLEGKRVTVIGSGATAMSIIPAIANRCLHVTMLQRSPTYVVTLENNNRLVESLRLRKMEENKIYETVRKRSLDETQKFVRRCKAEPQSVREEILSFVASIVGEDSMKRHFTPSYLPWQQRIAYIPNGDFLKVIGDGRASVITDNISRFTELGVQLESKSVIESDVIITATGFNFNIDADIKFSIDGNAVDLSDSVTYRGMMFANIPNLFFMFGYYRQSWTLRVELVAEFVCRMLRHMKSRQFTSVVTPFDVDQIPRSRGWTSDDFNPGYLKRSVRTQPMVSDRPEWRHSQDYWKDLEELPNIDLDGAEFRYHGSIKSMM